VSHPVHARYRAPPATYVPNPNKMETRTTHSSNYLPWTVPKVDRHKPETWKGFKDKFEGFSTAKSDFVAMPLPDRYIRPREKYEKSGDKMECETTTAAAFQYWKTPVVSRHPCEVPRVRAEPPF
jgi:hypothetical protein